MDDFATMSASTCKWILRTKDAEFGYVGAHPHDAARSKLNLVGGTCVAGQRCTTQVPPLCETIHCAELVLTTDQAVSANARGIDICGRNANYLDCLCGCAGRRRSHAIGLVV